MALQVERLITWASAGRYEMLATTAGPRGVTPMHLAALLPDGGAMAALLIGASGGGGLGYCAELNSGFRLAEARARVCDVRQMFSYLSPCQELRW